MYFLQVIEEALLERDDPIITDYGFFQITLDLYRKGVWQGQKISRLPKGWDDIRARSAQRRLSARRVIAQDNDFRSGVWRIVQATGSGSAEQVACMVDPFCYVSHLSAMERYGLTDRSPEALHLTTPTRPLWAKFRDEKVEAEWADIPITERAPLLRIGFKDIIRRRPVIVHETRHPARPAVLRSEETRVSSIGRTFADMLSEPSLCGGMHHVIGIWEEEAEEWLEDIIAAIDESNSKIVKVRAGYLLAERIGVQDVRIDSWAQFAQRGGSRKLDPDAPYAPRFSETWMLSLND